MSRRNARRKGRAIDGILLLDKAAGLSSNAALQGVKRLYGAAKAGHTGNLDPLATGMLPVCLGNATKVSAFLLDADKRYRVTLALGERTATGDAEGEVIERLPVADDTAARVEQLLPDFVGDVSQVPPMYSALKHKGERLYRLARQGLEVEREARSITIHDLSLVQRTETRVTLDVHCSKGTYVRVLAEDLAAAADSCGHVVELRRVGVGPYQTQRMWTQEELEQVAERDSVAGLDRLLLSVDSALEQWPAVELGRDTAFYLRRGNPVLVPAAPANGWVRVYEAQRGFIGMGEVLDDGRVAPRRMMSAVSG